MSDIAFSYMFLVGVGLFTLTVALVVIFLMFCFKLFKVILKRIGKW